MSYFNEYKWSVKLNKSLEVKKCCAGCGEKINYINTGKFRVNANKNNIDIWLIYKCEKCKHTWNVSIFERINPKDIDNEMLERFMNNDKGLAKEYGLRLKEYVNNGVKIDNKNISYSIEKTIIEENLRNKKAIVKIECDYNLDVRLDKFLSDNLNISRSKIKFMLDNGEIFSEGINKISKAKIKKGVKLSFLRSEILFENFVV